MNPMAKALAKTNRRIGECWSYEAAKDGSTQILISPILDDPFRVAGVVVHEPGTPRAPGPVWRLSEVCQLPTA